MKVIKENCDPKDAQDKSLPYTAYLVEYKVDGKERYDISIAQKAVDLFDYYYDLYKKDFVKFPSHDRKYTHLRLGFCFPVTIEGSRSF